MFPREPGGLGRATLALPPRLLCLRRLAAGCRFALRLRRLLLVVAAIVPVCQAGGSLTAAITFASSRPASSDASTNSRNLAAPPAMPQQAGRAGIVHDEIYITCLCLPQHDMTVLRTMEATARDTCVTRTWSQASCCAYVVSKIMFKSCIFRAAHPQHRHAARAACSC